MTNPLKPFLELVRTGIQPRLVSEFEKMLSKVAADALHRAALLPDGPLVERYPCPRVYDHCPRHIIPYVGPENYDVLAVPPDRHSCCEHLCLMKDQLRTYFIDERRLMELVSRWLCDESAIEQEPDSGVSRVGYFTRNGQRTRVFFCRRIAMRTARARLRDLETTGSAVVVVPVHDPRLPAELEERYSGRSNVRLLVLEDFMHLEGGEVALRPVSIESLASSPAGVTLVTPSAGSRLTPSLGPKSVVLTAEGEYLADNAELQRLRDRKHEFHLFLDLTRTVRGGGAAGSVCRLDPETNQEKVEEILFSVTEVQIILEYAHAPGRPIRPPHLRCVQEAGIRDGHRRVRILRGKFDQKEGRDQFRALQSHKGPSGKIVAYAFGPLPPGFKMALLLPPREHA